MKPALPPIANLLHVTDGVRLMQAVYVLAKLGIADHLADGPLGADDLAKLTDTHAPSLYRVLRAASAGGIFTELPDERFELNAEAQFLRADVPGDAGALFCLLGEDMGWRSYGALLHSVRTGETAFDHVFGQPIWRYVESDTEAEAVFDHAMTALSASVSRGYVETVKLEPGSRVADLGGGRGHLLAELLRANPECTGVLFDRAAAVAEAGQLLADRGVADRVTVVGGDFFTVAPPEGCDVYLLKSVLHVLPDEQAVAVLRWVRDAALAAGAKVLVLDRVVAGPGQWDNAKLLDLDMLVLYGGRDRTLAQWQELLTAAGYALGNQPEPGRWTVIECRPVPTENGGSQ
jgi:multifunctional cyclase/dehydratase/O-methyltransferase